MRPLEISAGLTIKPTGARDAVLASSGQGKSYLTGVIIEETLNSGVPVGIFDPEGEYWPLAECYPMVVVGHNVPMVAAGAELYAKALVELKCPIIFDFAKTEMTENQYVDFFAEVGQAIFMAAKKHHKFCKLVIDEAQLFCPQNGGNRDALDVCEKIAKRGRKMCLDALFSTQRPASINKNIISQCNRFFIGGVKGELDFNAVKPYLMNAGIDQQAILGAAPGQFYLFGEGQSTVPVKARKKRCRDAATGQEGHLSTFNQLLNPELNSIIHWLNESLADAVKSAEQKQSEKERLIKRIDSLEKQLVQEKQKSQIARIVTPMVNGLIQGQNTGTPLARPRVRY
jgi:hypothetical protein